MTQPITSLTADAYLTRLAERGVDYVFANGGTDFASIIEALASDSGPKRRYPKFVTVPHENVAMAMAHGYYRLAGKPAGVMVHVTVGTGNTICGLMNATRDAVPIILAAGRTPITDRGHIASRNRSIHWGQEAFDQGGMLREFVKWDYELRTGQPAAVAVDRAVDIAMTEPRGPVYLTLPREVLANPAVAPRREEMRPLGATPPAPDAGAVAETARLIAGAEFPLLITSRAGRSPDGFAALAKLADAFALPVVQSEATDLNLATNHAMNLGYDPSKVLPKADVILVLDSTVPWIPKAVTPKAGARIIHLSSDPLQTSMPYREFEADLLITGSVASALPLLHEALAKATHGQGSRLDARRKVVAELQAQMIEARRQVLDRAQHLSPVAPAFLAATLNKLKAPDAVIVNELGMPLPFIEMTTHGSFLGGLLAGGLGFGLGAGLGAKLAAPEREVISVVGDGSYMFGNPVPAHFVARAEKLPTLTIVNNNHSWHAVRSSTLDVHPTGYASKANQLPVVDLTPAPDYEKVVETCGGIGFKVETPDTLEATLTKALRAVRDGRPAVVNVSTQLR